jgi:hypothetical protein
VRSSITVSVPPVSYETYGFCGSGHKPFIGINAAQHLRNDLHDRFVDRTVGIITMIQKDAMRLSDKLSSVDARCAARLQRSD